MLWVPEGLSLYCFTTLLVLCPKKMKLNSAAVLSAEAERGVHYHQLHYCQTYKGVIQHYL